MHDFLAPVRNEKGFVLVTSMMALIVLVVIGISATTTTNIEVQIAGNEKLYKQAFYNADGSHQPSAELLEQNIACAMGFQDEDPDDPDGIPDVRIIGNSRIEVLDFYKNIDPALPDEDALPLPVVDVVFPAFATATDPHINVTIGGTTRYGTGAAIQMAAGYERVGKAAGGSGAHMYYDIFAQGKGVANTEVIVHTLWRHLVGQEGDCNY